jgi:diacylglycerol kinase (ATP)
VIAIGTGNDFARVNGLPVRDPATAGTAVARALRDGRSRALDLGRTGDRWFGTVLASGFDSRVNERANRMLSRLPAWATPGPLSRFRYDLAMVAELAALRPIPYQVTFDDAPEREIEATLIAVGNGSSYGGGMRICADAVMDDGLFDVCVVGPCSRRTLLRVFPRVYSGTHPSHPVVTVHRAARVRLDVDPALGVTGYADGERIGPLPLVVETVPKAVRLLV